MEPYTTGEHFLLPPYGIGILNFANSIVSGGQVSRVNPESTGLNPAWRKSLAYMLFATSWRDGANLTEIAAARQLLVQDMKLLEGIAPESGAYFNEVKKSHAPNLCKSD